MSHVLGGTFVVCRWRRRRRERGLCSAGLTSPAHPSAIMTRVYADQEEVCGTVFGRGGIRPASWAASVPHATKGRGGGSFIIKYIVGCMFSSAFLRTALCVGNGNRSNVHLPIRNLRALHSTRGNDSAVGGFFCGNSSLFWLQGGKIYCSVKDPYFCFQIKWDLFSWQVLYYKLGYMFDGNL